MRIIITDALHDKKITAIKAVRAVTGLGLQEAKECIDTAMSGVPTVLEGIDAAGLMQFRVAGIMCHIDNEYQLRLPIDKLQLMRELVVTLIDEGQFKSAQYIIDAMEVLDEI